MRLDHLLSRELFCVLRCFELARSQTWAYPGRSSRSLVCPPLTVLLLPRTARSFHRPRSAPLSSRSGACSSCAHRLVLMRPQPPRASSSARLERSPDKTEVAWFESSAGPPAPQGVAAARGRSLSCGERRLCKAEVRGSQIPLGSQPRPDAGSEVHCRRSCCGPVAQSARAQS